MTPLQFYLKKLAEEAGEVAHDALKAMEFGLDSEYGGETNRERINRELNDLMQVVEVLNDRFDLWYGINPQQRVSKIQKLKRFEQLGKSTGRIQDVEDSGRY